MNNRIQLPRELVNQLLQQAQSSPDMEICGLIGGHHNSATSCYPVKNVAENPGHRFWMDPKQQITAMRNMREKQESLFAIYHSHPDAPPEPSATDLETANYPETLQIIISLNIKGVLEMRGFFLRDNNQVEEVTLTLKTN